MYSMTKKEFAELLSGILRGYPSVTEQEIDQFVACLFKEIENPVSTLEMGKGFNSLVQHLRPWAAEWKAEERALLKIIQKFQKDFIVSKVKLTDVAGDLLGEAAENYHIARGELSKDRKQWTDVLWDADPEDGIVPFEETVNRLENSLQVIIDVLEKSIAETSTKAPTGRPKDISHDYFIPWLVVTIECVLGIEAKRTNNESDVFFSIIQECLSLVRSDGITINVSRQLKPCFEDYLTVKSMACYYKAYGRLDLFFKHLQKTSVQELIIETFKTEWSDWDLPREFWVYLQGQNSP